MALSASAWMAHSVYEPGPSPQLAEYAATDTWHDLIVEDRHTVLEQLESRLSRGRGSLVRMEVARDSYVVVGRLVGNRAVNQLIELLHEIGEVGQVQVWGQDSSRQIDELSLRLLSPKCDKGDDRAWSGRTQSRQIWTTAWRDRISTLSQVLSWSELDLDEYACQTERVSRSRLLPVMSEMRFSGPDLLALRRQR